MVRCHSCNGENVQVIGGHSKLDSFYPQKCFCTDCSTEFEI